MTQEKIEQLSEQICSEFVTDKDTTATFGVDFERKDIINALIAMSDEVIESIITDLQTAYNNTKHNNDFKDGIKWAIDCIKNNI